MKVRALPPVSAAAWVPETRSLRALQTAARSCRGCPLYKCATQTVFGEGPSRARMILVGEQPGNEEDLQGRPFVGPAGRLLDQALQAAGVSRESAYVTNVVKHFKWTPRGKRRLHQRPGASEIEACRPWLNAELAALEPEVLVCLGATAAQALISPKFKVTAERGKAISSELAPSVVATVHPSSILRSRSSAEREQAFAAFVADLRVAAALLRSSSARAPRRATPSSGRLGHEARKY
jgi:uracil-DNA glycosylase